MKKITSQIWLGLICVILGFMITYQFKASSSTQNKYTTRQYEDMAKDLESLKKQKDDLNIKVKEYQDKVDEYEKAAAKDSSYVKSMKNDLDKLRHLAGLEDEEGPGIVITITPPADVAQTGYSSINSNMILNVVNELNSTNKAEAISINDERYTGRTQVREVVNVIKINDARIDPTQPVIIKAIGDPNILFGAFSIPGNVLDDIKSYGLDVKYEKKDKVKILKYSKNLEYKYLK